MLRFLQRIGVSRGVMGDSRLWLWIAVASTSLRVARRILGRRERVVFSGELRPGQTLVIAHEREAEVLHPSV
jgi:hypothetical protein